MFHHLSPTELAQWITTWGYLGIFLLVFVGNIGVPMPEDTVLLAAGFLAGREILTLRAAFIVAVISAIIGDNFGYLLGRTGGRRLFTIFSRNISGRRRYRFMKNFFARHGNKTILLARFVVGLRLMAGPMAGASGMPFSQFFLWNVVGALVWCGAMLAAGYLLGDQWDMIAGMLHVSAPWIAIAVLSLVAVIYHFRWRDRQRPAPRLEF